MADLPEQEAWPRDRQKYAALVWISFLGAGFTSVVFFGLLDPLVLADQIRFLNSREQGYTFGFLFFWAAFLINGWLCLRITRRKRQKPRLPGHDA